jgi:ATP-dependent DNA helicase RecG
MPGVCVVIYDDRLEVTSTGSLHFGLTPEALFRPHESLPWNPLMAGVFYRRGFIEAWGRGTLKIAELAKQAGMPMPRIEDAGGYVTVVLRPSRYRLSSGGMHDLTERQKAIFNVLSSHGTAVSLRDILATMQPSAEDWEVKRDLGALKDMGLVGSSGRGRGAAWFAGRKK